MGLKLRPNSHPPTSFPCHPVQLSPLYRDLRLLSAYDPRQHFTEQRTVSLLAPGSAASPPAEAATPAAVAEETLEAPHVECEAAIADMSTAQYQAYDSIGKVGAPDSPSQYVWQLALSPCLVLWVGSDHDASANICLASLAAPRARTHDTDTAGRERGKYLQRPRARVHCLTWHALPPRLIGDANCPCSRSPRRIPATRGSQAFALALSLTAGVPASRTLRDEFDFLRRWARLSDLQRREELSRRGCHEVHFFVWHKDRPFFDAVVRRVRVLDLGPVIAFGLLFAWGEEGRAGIDSEICRTGHNMTIPPRLASRARRAAWSWAKLGYHIRNRIIRAAFVGLLGRLCMFRLRRTCATSSTRPSLTSTCSAFRSPTSPSLRATSLPSASHHLPRVPRSCTPRPCFLDRACRRLNALEKILLAEALARATPPTTSAQAPASSTLPAGDADLREPTTTLRLAVHSLDPRTRDRV